MDEKRQTANPCPLEDPAGFTPASHSGIGPDNPADRFFEMARMPFIKFQSRPRKSRPTQATGNTGATFSNSPVTKPALGTEQIGFATSQPDITSRGSTDLKLSPKRIENDQTIYYQKPAIFPVAGIPSNNQIHDCQRISEQVVLDLNGTRVNGVPNVPTEGCPSQHITHGPVSLLVGSAPPRSGFPDGAF